VLVAGTPGTRELVLVEDAETHGNVLEAARLGVQVVS
jgi:hypothetical protein